MNFVEQVRFFFSNNLYLEGINQLRGASVDSFLGKLFYNKLIYLYFYFKNLTAVLDIYFWVEKVGMVFIILFLIAFYLLFPKYKKFYIIMFILLLPVGFLNNLDQSFYYVVFIPFMIFLVYKFLWQLRINYRFLLISLLLINLVFQFVWPIKITL